MFFGTNDIQIQVGVLFNNEKSIVFNSSSSQNIIYKLYIQKIISKRKSKKKAQIQVQKIKKLWVFEFWAPTIMKYLFS